MAGGDFDGDGKADATRVVLHEGLTLVWCDDVWCRSARISGLSAYLAPMLVVAPDPNAGRLTRHLRAMDAFIHCTYWDSTQNEVAD